MKWTIFLALGLVPSALLFAIADEGRVNVLFSTPAAVGSNVVLEPFMWPVSPVISGHKTMIASRYGKRQSPSGPYPNAGSEEMHDGIDFAVPVDAAVRASQAGKVIFAGFSNMYVSRTDKTQKSRLVIIHHADGRSTRYVHLNRLRVLPGEMVQAGQVIGSTTDSDEWKEPVLHFEVRGMNGQPINPMPLLAAGHAEQGL